MAALRQRGAGVVFGYVAGMNIARRTLLTALPATLLMTRVARGQVAHRLTLLHVNDIHSRHEPVDSRSLTCKPGGRPDCFGGTARLAAALFAERDAAVAAGREVMLLDAGDQFQGSLYYTAWHGEVELAVMHAFGTEAMTVGNHEFDNGPEVLGRFVDRAKFPILSANIDCSAEPSLAGKLHPSIMLERAGMKIGVVGLTTTLTAATSSPGPTVTFLPPRPALEREAAALRAQGAKFVIALSHLGVAEDHAIAGQVPGVSVIVGGHSHTVLSDTEAERQGPAHALVSGPNGASVIVQAGCFARYFGRLDLDLDENGAILAVAGDTRHVGLDLPEHPGVAAIVAGYTMQLDAVRHRVVGHAPDAIDISTCRISECTLGNFVADAILASVQGADVALYNGGGLRTGLPAGDITIGDVLSVMPFGNTVATVQVTGDDLKAALVNGLSRAGVGGFPQVAGMRITWNPLAAPTERLRTVQIRQKDGSFAPLDPQRSYLLVTNNFLRTGGDGYIVLRDQGQNAYDTGPGVDEVIEAAITKASPLTLSLDGRISAE